MYLQSGTGGSENGTGAKRPRPIMAEAGCDVVTLFKSEEQTMMFDPRLADVVNQFE